MHPARDDDGLLLAVYLDVIDESLTKSLERWTRRDEVIFVVLKELAQFFFDGSVQQGLDLASRLLALLRQLLRVVVLLLE